MHKILLDTFTPVILAAAISLVGLVACCWFWGDVFGPSVVLPWVVFSGAMSWVLVTEASSSGGRGLIPRVVSTVNFRIQPDGRIQLDGTYITGCMMRERRHHTTFMQVLNLAYGLMIILVIDLDPWPYAIMSSMVVMTAATIGYGAFYIPYDRTYILETQDRIFVLCTRNPTVEGILDELADMSGARDRTS